MHFRLFSLRTWLYCVPLLLLSLSAQAAPQLLATIKPLHSLLAGLTEGLYSPQLLIDTPQSPHHYHLKPSDMRALQQAELIVYAGPEVESFMQRTLSRLDKDNIVALTELDGIERLNARALGHDDHGHDQDNHDAAHEAHHIDGHAWLSIHNARVLIDALLPRLQHLDAAHADHYQRNAQDMHKRLDTLEQDIRKRVQPLQDRPFIQFHDAFQYFEHDFGLSRGYSFTSGSEHKIGIQRLQEVRQLIRDRQIHCIFYEPPNRPPILNNLILDPATRVLPLDPLGTALPAGADLYFKLMDNIARQLEVCLQQK